MKVAVLAVQGAFEEQKQMLQKLGVETVELRQKEDVQQEYDGLILPGGESTVQRKLLQELDMYKELKKRITDGLPVLATCAGLILLAEEVEEYELVCFLPIGVASEEVKAPKKKPFSQRVRFNSF